MSKKVYLTMDSMVGKGGYDIDGSKKAKKFMKNTVHQVMKKLDVKKSKAVAAIAVILAIMGNGYRGYIENFETDDQGVAGIQVKITFESLEQMEDLFSEVI